MIHSRHRRAALLAASLTLTLTAQGAKAVWAQETPKTAAPPVVAAPVAPAALPAATPEQLKEGKSRLDAAVKAHGGEAFLKLKTITASAKGTLTPPGGQIPPIPIDSAKIYAGEKGQSRLEMETGFGSVILATEGAGKGGWVSFGGTVQDQPESGGVGDPTAILRAAALGKSVIVRSLPDTDKPQTTEDGKKLKGILVTNDKGRTATLFVDAETGLLRRIEAREGANFSAIMLDTYKTTDGILLPGKLVTMVNGQEALALTISDFVLNKPIDAALFVKPKE